MLITRIIVSIFSTIMMVLGVGTASSQTYPTKTIRFAAGGIGGGSDVVARLIAQGISGPLGQPVVVENRPSALMAETVAKGPPDGYLMFITGNNVWLQPFLQSTPYDPVRDLGPVVIASTASDVLVVHPSLPVKSVKELIALAKARPGALNYASTGTGGSTHLNSELFKSMAGVNIVRVAYKSSDQATTAVHIGEVQMGFIGAVSVSPLLKSGKLKALASAGARPSVLVPGIPTVGATLPGFESATTLVIFVQAKTPAPIISRLNQEMVRVLIQPETKERVLQAGHEVVGSTPEEAAAMVKADMARIGKVIKDAGIKIE